VRKMEGGAREGADAAEEAANNFPRPAPLARKLFRLKSLGEVQDTEENAEESEFKVMRIAYS